MALRYSHFGSGNATGRILLDGVHCNGSETRLIDCNHGGIGIHDCFHYMDAGVKCMGMYELAQQYILYYLRY